MSIKSYDRDYAKRRYKEIHNASMKRTSNKWWVCYKEDVEEYDGKVKLYDWVYCLHNGFENYHGSKWKGWLKEEANRGNRRKTHQLIRREDWDEIPNENTPVFESNPWSFC